MCESMTTRWLTNKRTAHSRVSVHVRCVEGALGLGCHVVSGVGRVIVQRHHADAIPSAEFFPENEYQAHEFNNCLYVKVDLKDPNRGEQSTRGGTSNSLRSVKFWEPFPSRVERPFLHAVGYENLLCSAACRSQNDALHVHFELCDTGFQSLWNSSLRGHPFWRSRLCVGEGLVNWPHLLGEVAQGILLLNLVEVEG